MKKILVMIIILLAVSLACSISASNSRAVENTPIPATETAPVEKILAEPTQTASISTVTALRALHVRDVPNGLVIGWLLNGEAVTRLGSCNRDGWVQVLTVDGITGWVNADYLDDGGCAWLE